MSCFRHFAHCRLLASTSRDLVNISIASETLSIGQFNKHDDGQRTGQRPVPRTVHSCKRHIRVSSCHAHAVRQRPSDNAHFVDHFVTYIVTSYEFLMRIPIPVVSWKVRVFKTYNLPESSFTCFPRAVTPDNAECNCIGFGLKYVLELC